MCGLISGVGVVNRVDVFDVIERERRGNGRDRVSVEVTMCPSGFEVRLG
jgi:hypothetical protein